MNQIVSNQAPAAHQPERRLHVRLGITMPALIQVRDDVPLRRCTVLDVSQGGGQLKLEGAIDVPDHFSLLFTPTGTVRRVCRVVWRRDCYVGVEFASPFDLC